MTSQPHLVLLAGAIALGSGCPAQTVSIGSGGATPVETTSHSVIASPSASAQTVVATASSSAETSGTGGSGDCPPQAIPPGVPAGWVEYTDWSCKCRFYIPGSPAAMPAPIQWQKCPTSPNGIQCDAMTTPWTNDQAAVAAGDTMMGFSGGEPVLGFQRNAFDDPTPYFLHVIGSPDGPIKFAFLKMWIKGQSLGAPGCFAYQHSLNEGKFIYSVLGNDALGKWTTSHHKGAIGGAINDLHPKVLADYDSELEQAWIASAKRVYRFDGNETAYSWDMKSNMLVAGGASDPDGLQIGAQRFAIGDSFFWMSDSSYASAIDSWNPVDGRRSLVRFLGDWTKSAGNLGTDGTTLVWTYGEGKQPNQSLNLLPTRSIMAAPFTTDPAKLVPKRLRSDPVPGMGLQFSVACGRAAHGSYPGPIVIVSLKDGMSWLFPAPSSPEFFPESVLGLTCDHVYVDGKFGGRFTIARIKLSSLGPAIPPD